MGHTLRPVSGLVLVSGFPACGKSTLARRLSQDLGWPVLSRDRLRFSSFEAISERLETDDQWRIGRTLDLVINHIATELLGVGVGAVIDSNFNWVQQADAVRALIEATGVRCFEVCLWADRDTCRRRFIERGEPPWSPSLEPTLERAVSRPREPVLGPPTPIVEFDTTAHHVVEHRRRRCRGES